MRTTSDLRYIAELEAELQYARFLALGLGAIVIALILALAVVK